jgi:hypothetical protein
VRSRLGAFFVGTMFIITALGDLGDAPTGVVAVIRIGVVLLGLVLIVWAGQQFLLRWRRRR